MQSLSFVHDRSLMTVLEELSKYKLDVVGVQEVRGTEVAPNQQANIRFSR
jgi:hypothetical protein